MRKSLIGFAAVAGFAAGASADVVLDAHVARTYQIGRPSTDGTRVVDPDAKYSNVTNFSGQVTTNAPGSSVGGITRMIMDDVTPVAGFAGQAITRMVFSVTNLNSVSVSVRPRLRFWFNDGAGGDPGTYYNGATPPAAVGFTFNPIAIPASSVNTFFFNPAAGSFNMPAGTMWCGMTFDNNAGGTGATNAQLDNMGQGIFDPPDVGSSTDRIFTTTAAGSFFGTNAPAGASGNFGGLPPANLGWEISAVPAPGSLALLGLGGLIAGRRRRS